MNIMGGALPYFTVSRVQRGHGFGSLLGGLLRTVAPLIKRGALALGIRALKTGAQIAGDVLSGENIRTAAKRRTKTAGRDLLQSRLATPPGKRVKRAAPKKRIKRAAPKKGIKRRTTTKRRQLPIYHDVFFLVWHSYIRNRVKV